MNSGVAKLTMHQLHWVAAKIIITPPKNLLNSFAEHNLEHNSLDFGALLKSIIGNFKSIIGPSLLPVMLEFEVIDMIRISCMSNIYTYLHV